LAIGDGISPRSTTTQFCVDINLTNTQSIKGVRAAVIDVPDEFQLSGCACTPRTPGFSCECNEIAATNRINVVILDTGGSCIAAGRFDLFDVLTKIDIVLGRATPTPAQLCLCDDTCDGRIDIFDILREIDALLGRIPTPLACPTAAASITPQAVPAGADGSG